MAQIQAQQVQLTSTNDRVWDNGPFNMASKIGMTYQQLQNELVVLRQSIEADLEKRLFVFVVPTKVAVMGDMLKTWKEIWEKFPLSKKDSMSAGECYALEQNTASVFHLMRVAEHGLRAIAKQVGVKLIDKGKPQPIEFATWDKVIQGIETKITAARNLSHGPAKNRRLQFYSNAAEHCKHIRDIWRNEVSHTRKDYNEGEALGILHRVKDFMSLLTTGI
jgi:hypothetical protein